MEFEAELVERSIGTVIGGGDDTRESSGNREAESRLTFILRLGLGVFSLASSSSSVGSEGSSSSYIRGIVGARDNRGYRGESGESANGSGRCVALGGVGEDEDLV